MRISLISTYTHPVALGLRYVSSYLKAAGHDVEMIFMSSKRDTARADFSSAAVEHLIERLRQRAPPRPEESEAEDRNSGDRKNRLRSSRAVR